MKQQIFYNTARFSLLMVFLFCFRANVISQETSRPKPNLSEMEKWYNISNITYDKYGTIKMDIVAKTNPPQTHRVFVFKYFDTNGKEVGSYNVMGVGYSTPKGQVEHVESYGISTDKISTIKSVALYLLNEDGSYTGPAKEAIQQAPVLARRVPATPTPAKPAPAPVANKENESVVCNFIALAPPNSNAPFSKGLAESAVYERYGFETNTGGLSSPLAVGITFSNIQLMDSYTNTVTVVPGRGAQRKNDAAPVNATIYRFHAKYVVCRKYNNTTRRTQYENDNAIFKASNGNWQSFTDGATKSTEL